MKPETPSSALIQLNKLAHLILRWNTRINLTAAKTFDQLWKRHIVDAQQIDEAFPHCATTVADVGSGAGLPGLVLAVLNSNRAFSLIEADRRKAAFLAEAARTLALTNVTVHACRVEDWDSGTVQVVTARALAPLDRLLKLTTPLLGQDGVAVFPKGRNVEAELAAASPNWSMHVERIQSRADTSSTILRLSGIQHRGAEK